VGVVPAYRPGGYPAPASGAFPRPAYGANPRPAIGPGAYPRPAIGPAVGTLPPDADRSRIALSVAVLVAVPLLALNLRPAVTSIGSLLPNIQSHTGMSAALASAVVAAPVWCFALGGGLAWALRVRWGTRRTVTFALTALAISLAARVADGPYLLLGGTVTACLSIAILGTLLPVIVHAAPAREWATLTGSYVAALGSGSAVGALVTPRLTAHFSWQLAASCWALLAAVAWLAWRIASRKIVEPPTPAARRTAPTRLAPRTTAWSLTLHFGLTSGVTFSIMGWLPSILLDRAKVAPSMVGWLFTIAMALGVPMALRVPKWARRSPNQCLLAFLLAAPTVIGVAGLLIAPTLAPVAWSVALGLGMPAVGLALTLISLRSSAAANTAAALSSMVQGVGYALAGLLALGCGLLHTYTHSWEWPLAGLMIVLCGQVGTGIVAGLPFTVYPAPRRVPIKWTSRAPVTVRPARRRRRIRFSCVGPKVRRNAMPHQPPSPTAWRITGRV
jgi:CP family cyanate transporter-like MFS transporter